MRQQMSPHFRENLSTWEWRRRWVERDLTVSHASNFRNASRGGKGGGWTKSKLWGTDSGSCEL